MTTGQPTKAPLRFREEIVPSPEDVEAAKAPWDFPEPGRGRSMPLDASWLRALCLHKPGVPPPETDLIMAIYVPLRLYW